MLSASVMVALVLLFLGVGLLFVPPEDAADRVRLLEMAAVLLLLGGTESVIVALRGSKRVVIEVPLYHYGSYQYEFNTAGLRWSKETDRQ